MVKGLTGTQILIVILILCSAFNCDTVSDTKNFEGVSHSNVDLIQSKAIADSVVVNITYGTESTPLKCVASLRCVYASGYIFAGSLEIDGPNWDSWIVKTDEDLKQEWNITVGGAGSDVCRDIVEADNGDFVLAGETNSYGSGGFDFWIVRIDRFGSVKWNKTYGTLMDETASSIAMTNDGGFLIAGSHYNVEASSTNGFILCIDEYGTQDWNETYGKDDSDEYFYSITRCANGCFALAGCVDSISGYDGDIWIVSINEDGSEEWNTRSNEAFTSSGSSVIECSTGGFAIIGSKGITSTESNACLIRLNSTGAIMWSSDLEGTNTGSDLVELDFGGFALCGTANDDVWTGIVSEQGSLEWSDTYGSSSADFADSLLLKDNHLLIGGSRDVDMWLIGVVPPPLWCSEIEDWEFEFGPELDATLYYFTFAPIDTVCCNSSDSFSVSNHPSRIIIRHKYEAGVGSFGIHVTLNDTCGACIDAEFTITIEDTTTPEWVSRPPSSADFDELVYANPGFIVEASDFAGIIWSVTGAGAEYFQFEDRDEGRAFFEENSTNRPPQGNYQLTITASDPSGNSISSLVDIAVTARDRGTQIAFPELAILFNVVLAVVVIAFAVRWFRSREK